MCSQTPQRMQSVLMMYAPGFWAPPTSSASLEGPGSPEGPGALLGASVDGTGYLAATGASNSTSTPAAWSKNAWNVWLKR